jgi:hypothetical protein
VLHVEVEARLLLQPAGESNRKKASEIPAHPARQGSENPIHDHGEHSLVHRLLELLLIEELQDEENQLPAKRRHGSPDPSRSLQLSKTRLNLGPSRQIPPKSPAKPARNRPKSHSKQAKHPHRAQNLARQPRARTHEPSKLTTGARASPRPSRRDPRRFRRRDRRSAAADAGGSNPAARRRLQRVPPRTRRRRLGFGRAAAAASVSTPQLQPPRFPFLSLALSLTFSLRKLLSLYFFPLRFWFFGPRFIATSSSPPIYSNPDNPSNDGNALGAATVFTRLPPSHQVSRGNLVISVGEDRSGKAAVARSLASQGGVFPSFGAGG